MLGMKIKTIAMGLLIGALGLAACGPQPTGTPTAGPVGTATGAAATVTSAPAVTATTASPTAVPPTATPGGPLELTAAGTLGRGQAFQMAWSPDGNTLAIGSSVGAYLLDANTLAVVKLLPADGPVYLVRFSPDGALLVGGGTVNGGDEDAGWAWVWDIEQGTVVNNISAGFWLNDLAVDPSGELLAIGGLFPTTQAQVWDLRNNEPLFTASPEAGGETIGTSVAFSPDGQQLALAGGAEGVVLYQPRTGELLGALPGLTGPTYDLAFSADGRWLAAGSTQQAAVWDVRQKTVRNINAEGEVWHVAFSANGQQLALASASAVQVVSIADGKVVLSLPTEQPILSVTYSAESGAAGGAEVLRAVDIGQTYAWTAADGAALNTIAGPLAGFTEAVQGLAFLDDDTLLSSELSALRVWDVAGSTTDRAWAVAVEGQPSLSPDGQQVANGYCEIKDALSGACALNLVGVWNVADGELIRSLAVHTQTVNATAFSPNGRWLASAGNDGAVGLWDMSDGALVYTLTLHTSGVAAVAFSPDSHTLASSAFDGQVILWDVDAGTPRTQLTVGTSAAAVYALAFSPDGTLLATGSAAPDSLVRLWRVADGAADANPLAELAGHPGDIRALRFAPSGAWLVSGGAPAPAGLDDETVRVWALTPDGGRLEQSLAPNVGAVFALAFSPDGQTLAAGGADGVVALWTAGR